MGVGGFSVQSIIYRATDDLISTILISFSALPDSQTTKLLINGIHFMQTNMLPQYSKYISNQDLNS